VSRQPIRKRRGDTEVSAAELDNLTPTELQQRVDVWTRSGDKILNAGRDRERGLFRMLMYGRNKLPRFGISPTMFRVAIASLLVFVLLKSLSGR
jgi:hypothetical protein